MTSKGKIVVDMINKFPKASSSQLSRKLYEKYPLVFSSQQNARSVLRYYRDASGAKDRATKKTAEVNVVEASGRHYAIAKTKARKRRYHHIPSDITDVVVLSDIHFPNHDEQALRLACEYVDKVKPGAIVLNGDVLDNTPFTKFRKPPSAKSAKGMFDMAIAWLRSLRENNPDAIIWWIEGNHDKWYKNWLIDHCEQVWDDSYYQLEARMQLEQMNIKYIEEYDVTMCGKLPLLHGHTVVKGVFAPVNSARGVWMKLKQTCMIGHTHQVSQHTERDLVGKVHKQWSLGCLCTIHPEYDPHNTRHSHGFAHITKDKSGRFVVRNFEIIEGIPR